MGRECSAWREMVACPMSEPQASVKSKISRSGLGRRRMSTSVASDFEAPRPSHRGRVEKAAIVAAKLFVTGACFWYLSRQIDWRQVSSTIPLLDFRWAVLAACIALLQIPL